MKARYLGIIFVAAVLVPSVLLAVLSIRSAGREEAYVEKQLATTLLAEVTHAAGLVSTGMSGIAAELHKGAGPLGSQYPEALPRWKKQNPLVAVPFLLSPRYGILWPDPGGSLDSEERLFLDQNADFLTGRSATAIYANIAVLHKEQVLAEAKKLEREDKKSTRPARAHDVTPAPSAAGLAGEGGAAAPRAEAEAGGGATARAAPAARAPAQVSAAQAETSALESQQALDAFAQSPQVQARIYEEARRTGEQLNLRVAQPTSKALAEPPDVAPAAAEEKDRARETAGPSQYVATSKLLSQIASQGEYGIIPRFIGDKLIFLFWNRQADGKILGCQIASAALRGRLAGILPSTYSPVRILTVLDETGQPLAVPPGAPARDWRRPFVSQEIGESLPRWEAASYLTDPEVISSQARAASTVIWILVVILFVSVAGGGTMVLTSLYSEMRLAQKKAGFVANVSHELKTPLTSIGLFVDLMRRGRRPDPQKQEHYLALMAAETERLGRLINNVLDFSAHEKGRRKYSLATVELAQTAGDVVEGQRVRLEGLGFSVSFLGPAASPVKADPEAVKQVLINLLSNAEKYSPRQKEIEVEVIREAACAEVHVRDRGIGVAEKDRERIFREFVRVDDSLTARVPGTGLGLTIARRIARDLGGDLVCEGRPEGGSDFVLRLPVEEKK